METSTPQQHELKYGIIYVRRNSQRVRWQEQAANELTALAAPLQVQWTDDESQDGMLLIARRFNVGNLGRCATVSLHLTAHGAPAIQGMAMLKFRDALTGMMDCSEGDIVIDEGDFGGCVGHVHACHSIDYAKPRRKIHRSVFSKFSKTATKASDVQRAESCDDDEDIRFCIALTSEAAPDEAEFLDRAEADEVDGIERQQQEELEQIRNLIVNYIAKHQADPEEMIRTLLRGKVIVGQPGRLLVNGDMKIVLPEYDEMEIKMPAMCRALYILFMKLRSQGKEGIVLKNIDEYRDDLANIYGLVKPGARDDLVQQYIDRLCDPWNESLNQTISKVNRCVKNHITSKDMQQRYCITGQPGRAYGIAIDPALLTLPAAVTM